MNMYLSLGIAIAAEIAGTAALQASQAFTKLVPSLVVPVAYGIAFYFLALTLKSMPVGVAYALWSGLGIVLISIVAYFLFGQKMDAAALLGCGLIIAGVVVIQLFSKTATH